MPRKSITFLGTPKVLAVVGIAMRYMKTVSLPMISFRVSFSGRWSLSKPTKAMQDFVASATKSSSSAKPTVSWTIYVTAEQSRTVEAFRSKFNLTRQEVLLQCFSAGLEQLLGALPKEVRDEL